MVSIFEKIGFASFFDYLFKVVFPITGLAIIFYFLVSFFHLPKFTGYVILLIGIIFVIVYPVIVLENRRLSIEQNLHYFITYAGALATVGLPRPLFFQKLGEKEHYGYTSKLMKKLLYLAKKWNLGFARTSRKLAKLCPSKILADFLDRMASALDFGVDLETFLWEEQDAVMNDYATQYRQSIENISMIREMYIALTIAFAFSMSAALLLPMVLNISMGFTLKMGTITIITIDAIMIVLTKAFVPSDNLLHKLKIKEELWEKTKVTFFVILAISTLIFYFINKTNLDLLVKLAVSSTPLLIVGFLGERIEKLIMERDRAYPAFVRSLGSTLYAQGTSVPNAVKSLLVHDLGPLNKLIQNLYKRLALRIDANKAWQYFSGESGSNLITQFNNIFYESLYLGGDPIKISEVVSKNFLRQLSLRKLRLQVASSLRGALYGALLGFVGTLYISFAVANTLANVFNSVYDENIRQGQFAGLISSLIPSQPMISENVVMLHLGVIVIIHSFFSSFMLKMIDGGTKFSMFLDFVLMLWIGAITVMVVPMLTSKLLTIPTV